MSLLPPPPPPRLASCLSLTALVAVSTFAAFSRPASAQEISLPPVPVDFKMLEQNPPPPVIPSLPSEGIVPTPKKFFSDVNDAVFAADQIVVKFKGSATEPTIRNFLAANNLVQQAWNHATGFRLLTIPGPVESPFWLKLLNESPLVERAEFNRMITTGNVTPLDSFYGRNQWNLRKIGMEAAWERTRGGTFTTAVIDTGITTTEQPYDLTPKILRDSSGNLQGRDYTGAPSSTAYRFEDDDNTNDPVYGNPNGHGTFVSGIIGADTVFSPQSPYPNSGIAGVNPYGPILPMKILSPNRTSLGSTYALSDAMTDAANFGNVRVINASLQDLVARQNQVNGNQTPLTPYTGVNDAYFTHVLDALKTVNDRKVLFVGITGNYDGRNLQSQDSRDKISLPGAFWRTMAIGSTDINDQVSSFSRRGYHISTVAPGENVYSTRRSYPYTGYGSGTSFAAPHVAGLAGILLNEFPTMTWWDLRYHIEDTVDYLTGQSTFDYDEGWGRINADKATQVIISPHGFPATTSYAAQQLLISIPAWPVTSYADDNAASRAQDVAMMFPGANAQVAWYDPTISGYRPYSDTEVPRFGPGRGYFVKLSQPVNTSYLATLPFQKSTHPVPTHLKPGFNGIGVPGHNTIVWDRYAFRVATAINTPQNYPDHTRDGMKDERTLDQAIAAGWIEDKLYAFDASVPNGQYAVVPFGASLYPGVGYFIKANIECQLLIPSH